MDSSRESEIVSERRVAYGGVGIVIMMISMMAVIKFIPRISENPLLEIVAFICICGILWLVFQAVMSLTGLGFFLFNGRGKGKPATKRPIPSTAAETPSAAIPTPVSEAATPSDLLIRSEAANHDDYQSRNEAVEAERQQRENNIIVAIDKYLRYVMAPYMEERQLNQLCAEVMGWSEDSHYSPSEVRLSKPLSPSDLCHLAWNIGARLNMISDGYTGIVRAVFVKDLFPSVMKSEAETIRRNLTTTQGRCVIAIDKPEEGGYEFHYPGE